MPSQPRQSNITKVCGHTSQLLSTQSHLSPSTSLYCGRRLRTFFERIGLIAAGRNGSEGSEPRFSHSAAGTLGPSGEGAWIRGLGQGSPLFRREASGAKSFFGSS